MSTRNQVGQPPDLPSRKKHSASNASTQAAAPAVQLSAFTEPAPPALDAPAWPVHLTLWLEPPLTVTPPTTSGLRVERTHAFPARTFLGTAKPTGGLVPRPAGGCPTAPELEFQIPRSALEPAGWDPLRIFRASGNGGPGFRKEDAR